MIFVQTRLNLETKAEHRKLHHFVSGFLLLCECKHIGVRAGGARGAAAPPKFGQLRFFGQQEKIWAKPVFKDISTFFFIIIILKR